MVFGLLAIVTGVSFVNNYEALRAKEPGLVWFGDHYVQPRERSNLWPRDVGFVSIAFGGGLIIFSLNYSGLFYGGQP